MDPGELICPACGREHDAGGRFCEECGMLLVYPERAEREPSSRRQRARKVKPQYTEGPLVVVARASDLGQAEFIAGLLLEEGIPCTLRTAIAGYAPVVGSREVLVAESAAQVAREALTWERPAD